jgi:hypothetical protein
VSLFFKRKEMLAEVARPICSEDSKLGFLEPRRKHRLPFEETRLARVIQTEFIRNLIAINPLSPYFELIRIPETSGSDGASSKHPDFSPHQNFFSLLQIFSSRWAEDIDD